MYCMCLVKIQKILFFKHNEYSYLSCLIFGFWVLIMTCIFVWMFVWKNFKSIYCNGTFFYYNFSMKMCLSSKSNLPMFIAVIYNSIISFWHLTWWIVQTTFCLFYITEFVYWRFINNIWKMTYKERNSLLNFKLKSFYHKYLFI